MTTLIAAPRRRKRPPSRQWLMLASAVYGLLGAAFFLGGGRALWVWWENPQPLQMPLSQYLRDKPAAQWVRLTDCRVDYAHGVFLRRQSDGQPEDVCVPVYPTDDTSKPVEVVLGVPRERQNQAISDAAAGGLPTETLEGLVRGGLLYTGIPSKLKDAASWDLADQYVILDQDRQPSVPMIVGCFAAAVVIFAALGRTVYVLRRRPAPIGAS